MTSDTYSFNGNAYNVWDYNEEGDNGYNNNHNANNNNSNQQIITIIAVIAIKAIKTITVTFNPFELSKETISSSIFLRLNDGANTSKLSFGAFTGMIYFSRITL